MIEKIKDFLIKYKFLCFVSVLIILLVMLDQTTKSFALETIETLKLKTNSIHHSMKITSFFNLVLVFNEGITFGMLNQGGSMSIILLCINSLVLAGIIYLIKKNINNKYEVFSYGLVVAGAAGNLIDRFRYGAVVDFLDFHINALHWPAFNLADSLIVIAVVLLLVEDLVVKKIK